MRSNRRVLSFRLADDDPRTILDNETDSRWSLAHGEAVAGPLKGSALVRARAYPAYWFGWQGYFPATDIWKRPDRPESRGER